MSGNQHKISIISNRLKTIKILVELTSREAGFKKPWFGKVLIQPSGKKGRWQRRHTHQNL